MPARERGDKEDDRVDRGDRDRDRERRRRSRSRDRGGERGAERSERRSRRSRSRSRSPSHKRKRSPSASNTSTAGPSGKHEEPPMSALTEEERQMKELMGFGSFHSTKGEKEFAVWGSSCVQGKRREELPDFEEYQEWIDKKRKAFQAEVITWWWKLLLWLVLRCLQLRLLPTLVTGTFCTVNPGNWYLLHW